MDDTTPCCCGHVLDEHERTWGSRCEVADCPCIAFEEDCDAPEPSKDGGTLSIEHMLSVALKSKPGGRYIFVTTGPRIASAWRRLAELAAQYAGASVNHHERRVTLQSGTTVSVVGVERPEKIMGVELGDIHFDEVVATHPNVWEFISRMRAYEPSKDGGK